MVRTELFAVRRVALGAESPCVIGLAEAVDEHGELGRGVREGVRERVGRDGDVSPRAPDRHRRRERAPASVQAVAERSVEAADREPAGDRLVQRARIRRPCAADRAGTGAEQPATHDPHGRVGLVRDLVVHDLHRRSRAQRPPQAASRLVFAVRWR